MCCCSEDRDRRHGGGGCGCDCDDECECSLGAFPRRFQTKAEHIEEIMDYLEELKLELQAVEEKLADLRK
jgi:hypothetical protein